VENTNEKKETLPKVNNCGNNKTPPELLDFKKICSSRCSICNSGILKEIHDWRKSGADYNRIRERAKDEFNVEISPSGLSRHFKSYVAFKVDLATQLIKEDTLEEITSQAVHLRKTVELLDIVYEKIKAQLKANTYKVDISDLEKLAKMRYQILNGDNLDEKDLMAVFQKASNDYGLNLEQGVLFKV